MITKALAANFVVNQIGNPTGFPDLGALISVLLQAAIIAAGLGAFAYLILSGVQFLTSGGDKIQVEAARNRITYAIIGLTIVVGAYALVRVIETIFGVSIVSGINWPGP